jgi:hypothetical protein
VTIGAAGFQDEQPLVIAGLRIVALINRHEISRAICFEQPAIEKT